MIREHYPLRGFNDNRKFLFRSFGKKGLVFKLVEFEEIGEQRYNLAFGDFVDGVFSDSVVTNNFDILKTISTVAEATYRFFDNYQNAILEIEAIDERRLRLYNRILNRKHDEIVENLNLFGYVDGQREVFQPNRHYYKFEIQRKKG